VGGCEGTTVFASLDEADVDFLPLADAGTDCDASAFTDSEVSLEALGLFAAVAAGAAVAAAISTVAAA
jgi:hypothetical protein